jgi:hypothetical protein
MATFTLRTKQTGFIVTKNRTSGASAFAPAFTTNSCTTVVAAGRKFDISINNEKGDQMTLIHESNSGSLHPVVFSI